MQRGRQRKAHRGQTLAFDGLSRRVIDLDDPDFAEKVGATKGEGVESGSQNHILLNTPRRRPSQASPPRTGLG